jgi:hypothetical protein
VGHGGAGWSAPTSPQPLTHPEDFERPQDRIMIYGLKADSTYLVEFRTAAGIPRTEAAVIRYSQARMPYGLVVPDVKAD